MTTDPIQRAARGTRFARWGIFVTTVVMGAALVVTGVTTWVQQRDAANVVAEARALDLFRGVRKSLRDELGNITDTTANELLAELADAGLRYVGLFGRDQALTAGDERGRSKGLHVPGEPELTRFGDRIRVDGALGPRRRGRLVLEVQSGVAESLAASALTHLIVSSGAAALLLGLAFVFWRMAIRADRAEGALQHQRRLAALGEMSAVLGHELRNPLAALKGHAQLVVERLEPEAKAYKNAERVVAEAERIETLTTHILDFARTGAVEPKSNDPAAMVRAIADKVGAKVDVGGAPKTWSFDRPRMEQVLDNVVKNARHVSDDVTITCTSDGALVLRVEDRGPGFAPGEEEAVFEPFRTTRIQGTGLGLAIARRIVQAHGGTIVASNAASGGAVVEVRLPAREST